MSCQKLRGLRPLSLNVVLSKAGEGFEDLPDKVVGFVFTQMCAGDVAARDVISFWSLKALQVVGHEVMDALKKKR